MTVTGVFPLDDLAELRGRLNLGFAYLYEHRQDPELYDSGVKRLETIVDTYLDRLGAARSEDGAAIDARVREHGERLEKGWDVIGRLEQRLAANPSDSETKNKLIRAGEKFSDLLVQYEALCDARAGVVATATILRARVRFLGVIQPATLKARVA